MAPKNAEQKNKEKLSFFEWMTEVIGWLQIVLSPTLIGLVLAFLLYYFLPTSTGLVLSIIVALTGLIIGIIWATKIWKQKGTIEFMSGISATTDFDKVENKPE